MNFNCVNFSILLKFLRDNLKVEDYDVKDFIREAYYRYCNGENKIVLNKFETKSGKIETLDFRITVDGNKVLLVF